jgi:hypothetical protein
VIELSTHTNIEDEHGTLVCEAELDYYIVAGAHCWYRSLVYQVQM